MTDLLIIIGLTLASRIAVGLIGLFLLHLARYRSLRQQLTIATPRPALLRGGDNGADQRAADVPLRPRLVGDLDRTGRVTALLRSAPGWWSVGSRKPRRWGDGSSVSDSRGTSVVADSVETAVAPRELAQVLDDLAETRRTLAESRTRERAAEQSCRWSASSHDCARR